MSLHLKKEANRHKLTLVGYPAGYILKPQSKEYAQLPELENMEMQLADTALALQGKKSRLNRDDFLHLAQHVGMDLHVCERIITRLAGQFGEFEYIIDRSYISETLKADMKGLLKQRLKRLTRR